MINIIGLMGSPRAGGNTDLLLDQVLQGAQSKGGEIKKLSLFSYNIKPCLEIYGCRKTGRCVIKDDHEKILESIFEADVIVLASPIFFYSLPSHTKAMVDRCQSLWVNKYILKNPLPIKKERRGYFVSAGATKGKSLFDGARLTVKYFFDVFDAYYTDELLIRGLDEKGSVKSHPEALQAAWSLGESIIKIA